MNRLDKKLIALAIAGVFALPVAAKAQTANVTIYGRANMDLEVVKVSGPGDATGSNATVTRVASNSSRFGLLGTELLGGGLSAFIQLENSVNWDGNGTGNANTIANRETWLGLQGSWGRIKLGRGLSPYDDTKTPIWSANPLNYETGLFATNSVWANESNGGGNPESGSYDDKYSNGIRWDSPAWSGFSVELHAATQENTGHGWMFSPGLFYSNGPVRTAVAYVRHDKLRCYIANSYTRCANPGPFAAKDDAIAIAGSYDFGVVRLALNYEYLKYETPTGDLKRNFWGVTTYIPAGGGTIFLFYGKAGDGTGSADDATPRINSLAHGADTGAQNFIVGYSYFLSKRTMVNVGYALIRNDARANYTFSNNGFPVTPGGDPSGIALGIAHSF